MEHLQNIQTIQRSHMRTEQLPMDSLGVNVQGYIYQSLPVDTNALRDTHGLCFEEEAGTLQKYGA